MRCSIVKISLKCVHFLSQYEYYLCPLQERHRIDVDCRRTDRTQPLFQVPSPSSSPFKADGVSSDEKEAAKRYSAISPNMNDIGSQAPSNDHIERLAGILLTYNFYEKELGGLNVYFSYVTRLY